MRLQEAHEKAKDGDTIKSRSTEIIKGERERLFPLSVTLRDDWQINPVKKGPIDFDKWWKSDRQGYALGLSEAENRITWKASAENRDIFYSDLMGAIANWESGEDKFGQKVLIEFHKIKQ